MTSIHAAVLLSAIGLVVGCSGSDSGSAGASGGEGNAGQGGAPASGGNLGSGGMTARTASSTGGANASGGTSSPIGTKSAGGGASTGGALATGGSKSSGGAASGSGGAKATGGSANTGGANPTGGTQPNGGASSTSKVTGGASSTGGRASTGGTSATGGLASTGGMKSTGGATSTGGSKATGGATGNCPAMNPNLYAMGADVSQVPQDESGAQTRYIDTDGQQKDILAILKNHGFNYVRLRTFVDPKASDGYSTQGFCDIAHTVAMAKRVKQACMGFLLDLHYSDNWADPGKQCIPVAWQGMTLAQMTQQVHDYTVSSVQALVSAGARPDIVQVGNEITPGMLIHI